MRGRDSLRSEKPDMGRDMRFPPHSLRERMQLESRGRDDHRHSPRRRSPGRDSRDRIDANYDTVRSRSQDGLRRLSAERRSGRDAMSPRDRRVRSPRFLGRATPPARSPRLASRGAAQAAASAVVFPGEFVGRRPAEALLSSRIDNLDRHGPLFHIGSGTKDMGDALGIQGDQSSIGSYGMLVSRSMILEDGSVRTFYTLPPDPSLDAFRSSAEDGSGGKFLPSFGDAIPAYGADGRSAPVDALRFGEPNRGDLIATHDRLLTDRKFPGQNQFIAGDEGLRAWPGSLELGRISTARRERSPSPHRSAMDMRLQRRASRSPLRDGIPRFGREGGFNSLNRDLYAPELERSARTTDFGRRGLSGDAELALRERLATSPRRRGPIEDPRMNADRGGIGYGGNSKHDEPMRIVEDGRLGPHRGAPSLHQRDISNSFPRVAISPREGGTGFPRSSRISGFSDGPTYEQSRGANGKQFRSPPPETSWDPRDEINAQRRGSIFRAGMEIYGSPKRGATNLSPRRQRSLSPSILRQGPLDLYGSEKRAWKRKYGEREQEFHELGRVHRLDEPEFKRGREGNLYPNDDLFGSRIPGYERPDGYIERREREGGDFTRGDYLDERRPWEDKDGSPRLPRRFPLVDDRRGVAFNDRDTYLPPINKPHGFQREGGTLADKNSFWRDNDMQRDFVREGEPQLVPDLPEDSPEFKQQVHRAYMKYAKLVNENPGQRKRYEEQGKAGTLLCLACSRFSKPFVDTHSLVMHTHMSKKRGLRAEHLGLCKAICTVMSWSSDIDPTNGKAYQQMPSEEAKANKEDLILWPPAVVIHNAAAGKINDGQQEGVSNSAVKELLKDLGLTHEKIKIVDGKQGSVIVKYLATFSCLHEAETLHQHFASIGHGREDWLRIQSSEKESLDLMQGDSETKHRKKVLYGYLALANDLDKIDLEFRRRCLVRSRKEIETILDDSLTS